MFNVNSKIIIICLFSLVLTGCSDSDDQGLDIKCKARLNLKYIKKQGLYDHLYKGSMFSRGPMISNEKTCKARWKQGEVVARGKLYGQEVEQVFLGIYIGSNESDYVFKNFYTKTQKEASDVYLSNGRTYHNNSNFANTAYLGINNGIRLIDQQGVTRIHNNYFFGKPVWQKTWFANGQQEKMFYMSKDGLNGEFRKWYENGGLAVEGDYHENKPVGVWKYWDPQGNLAIEYTYVEGEQNTDKEAIESVGAIRETTMVEHRDDKHIKKGLTWIAGDSINGIVHVNCGHNSCNPYEGDTACTEKLPLLCIQKKQLASPDDSYSFQALWSGGNIVATEPIEGLSFKSLKDDQKNGTCWKQ